MAEAVRDRARELLDDFVELARQVASASVEHPLPDEQALPLLAFIQLLPEPSAADQEAWLAARDAEKSVEELLRRDAARFSRVAADVDKDALLSRIAAGVRRSGQEAWLAGGGIDDQSARLVRSCRIDDEDITRCVDDAARAELDPGGAAAFSDLRQVDHHGSAGDHGSAGEVAAGPARARGRRRSAPSQRVQAKAATYLLEGRVKVVEAEGGWLRAVVRGGGRRPYEVRCLAARLDWPDWRCACPATSYWPYSVCSHIVACQAIWEPSQPGQQAAGERG